MTPYCTLERLNVFRAGWSSPPAGRNHRNVSGMELFSRRRWRLESAQVISCCVRVCQTQIIMQLIGTDYIPFMFDGFWYDPVVHLLLLKISIYQGIEISHPVYSILFCDLVICFLCAGECLILFIVNIFWTLE